MKNNTARFLALLLALLMVLSLIFPVIAAEADTEIRIQSAEDLLDLAESCRLDTWSQNKTVILEADISLADTGFTPIPTFGGTFHGNGHTISGLELLGSSAPAGLFGVLQSTAVVEELTVKGAVAPSGDAASVGGLAGENSGIIRNCRFEGTVIGESNTGGIAGCTVSGIVIGEKMTGGIVGQNSGIITGCKNEAEVNTVSVDPSISLDNLNGDFLLDISKWTSLDAVTTTSDTGGIAGYSSGSILSCSNSGSIGYPKFDEGAVLEAEALPKTPAAFDVVGEDIPDIVKKCFSGTTLYLDVTEQWLLRLPEDGADSHTVRYLSPDENADRLTIFVKSGGVWREIESKAVGSYLVFTLDGAEAEIAILSTMPIWWVWLIPLALVLILILLIARIVHGIRRRRQPLSQEELQQKAERAEAELARIHAQMERLQSSETPIDAEKNGGNPENGSGQSKDEPEE